jgi:hypothetical protein
MKIIGGEKALIKNIIYLDVDKMYSMSSQVFEGVTEYILSEKVTGTEKKEDQKGPIASGKVLGDILRQQESVSEKKVLIDHSYALFEEKLVNEEKVTSFAVDSQSEFATPIKLNSFIKIRGKATFNDLNSIKNTISNFNKVGKALATVTSYGELNKNKALLQVLHESGADKMLKKPIEAEVKRLSNIDQLQRSGGLYQDPDFMAQLALTLDYGYQDQLEIQINSPGRIFSANLKRECLREKEDMIIRKYSRRTEVEFILFGICTQVDHLVEPPPPFEDGGSIKEALMNLVGLITQLESAFIGRMPNEVIIDPIAIYTEIG